MCGLFGIISQKKQVDTNLLQMIAREAGRRGPNAWGLCWNDGSWHRFVQAGLLTEQWNIIPALVTPDTTLCIGQSRLATSGSYKQYKNNQPLIVDLVDQQMILSHNGNVYNSKELIKKYDLQPKTACDSEILGLCIARQTGTIKERIEKALEEINQGPAYAFLIATNDSLYAYRKSHPLYSVIGSESHAFCSRKWSEEAQLINENKVEEVVYATQKDANQQICA